MKIAHVLFVVCMVCGTLFGAGRPGPKENALNEFMMNYHRKPVPEKVTGFLKNLDSARFSEGAAAPICGFFFEICLANSARVPEWSETILKFKNSQWRSYLALFLTAAAPGHQELVKKIGIRNVPTFIQVNQFSCVNPDFSWGRFFATGKREHVKRVLDLALSPAKSADKKRIDLTARSAEWSLHALAQQQKEVAAALKDLLKERSDAELAYFFRNAKEEEKKALLDPKRAAALPASPKK